MRVEHRFLGYHFATGDVPGLLPSLVGKRHCSGSEALETFPGRDQVCLQRLKDASMERFRAYWRVTYGYIADGHVKVEFRSVDVPE